MNDRLHATHHVFDSGAVCDVGDDQFLVGRQVRHRPDVRQAQVAPATAKSGTQRRADGACGTGDDDAIRLGVDHGRASAHSGVTRQMTLPTSSAISRDR